VFLLNEMMTFFCINSQQDTISVKNVIAQDSLNLNIDSVQDKTSQQFIDSLPKRQLRIIRSPDIINSDTTSVCTPNIISPVTFYDPDNLVNRINQNNVNHFPYSFIEINKRIQSQTKTTLLKSLKPGQDMPFQPLHDDWIIAVILISAFMFSLVRNTYKNLMPDITSYFLFRGINDSASRNMGELFHWQSTILNFSSFLIISLFVYKAATFYLTIPAAVPGILSWIISLGIIISSFTLRHIVCIVTGNSSGQIEIFREYLVSIYTFYRLIAISFFIIVILMTYTSFLPSRFFLTTGIIVLGIFYSFRIIRLLVIFINRNISIFYLILYLCALEILPVLIAVKYFTGLV
jgi:hypothetical protein